MSEQTIDTSRTSNRFSSYLTMTLHEIQANFKFVLFWILGINAYFLLAISIYPGEEAVNNFLQLVESEEAFAALLGSLGGEAPGYRTWLALMLPFIVTANFIFSLMVGVRLSVGAISDDTGELIHPQPLTRRELLGVRYIVGVLASFDMIFVSSLLLMIPVHGESLPLANIFTFAWTGLLFMAMGVALGMVFGTIAADSGRGYMFSLFFAIYIYAIQTMGNILEQLQDVAEYIPLNWYSPSSAILRNEVPDNTVMYMTVSLVIFLVGATILFSKRDLIKEAAIPIPLISRIRFKRGNGKSDRDRLLVRWARPFDKKLPFTADFIYSERRVLLIVFWTVIMFYPAQILLFQPNDPEFMATLQETVDGFGGSGLMKVLTYGHDLSGDLYLWFIITNAIGNHYFIFLPLAAHWIKKILQTDNDHLTGEIYGAYPIKSHNVMLQRLLAVLLELLFVTLQMVFWLVFSEMAIGYTENQMWRVISIISIVPFYIFLISAGLTLGLLVKNGVRIARLSLIGLILWFIAGVVMDGSTGLFGLYDPVLIITEQSLTVANYGVFWVSGLAVMFSVIISMVASHYHWLDIPKADRNAISSS